MSEMQKTPRIFRRGDTYYHRVSIPADIADAYFKRFGKKNRIKSLGTKDRKEAKRLCSVENVEADREFDECRQLLLGDVAIPQISSHAAKSACEARFNQIIDDDFRRRAEVYKEAEADPEALYRGRIIPLPNDDRYFHLTQEGTLEDILAYCFKAELKRRLRDLKRAMACGRYDVEDDPRIGRGLLQAEISAVETLIARDFIEIEDEPTESSETLPSFSDATETYVAEMRRSELNPTTISLKEAAFREFVEVAGNKPLPAYRKSDGSAYKQALSKAPAHHKIKKEFEGLSLIEAGERADALGNVPRLNINTINGKLGHVSAFFRWAQSNHDGDIVNPVDGLKIRETQNRMEKRQPFSPDDLRTLFSVPIYTGCESEGRWSTSGDMILRTSAKYWIPLVGLFTGMRLGEIMQLTSDDIREAEGVTFIDVNKDEDWKVLKSPSADRRIPVHPELVKLGFLKFVATRTGRLFSDYEQAKSGSWSDHFSKHFRRSVGSVGLSGSFHRFRHSFEDACRNGKVPAEVMDALQGHSQKGMRGVYGSGFGLKVLNEAIQKIEYDGLDLNHLVE